MRRCIVLLAVVMLSFANAPLRRVVAVRWGCGNRHERGAAAGGGVRLGWRDEKWLVKCLSPVMVYSILRHNASVF